MISWLFKLKYYHVSLFHSLVELIVFVLSLCKFQSIVCGQIVDMHSQSELSRLYGFKLNLSISILLISFHIASIDGSIVASHSL